LLRTIMAKKSTSACVRDNVTVGCWMRQAGIVFEWQWDGFNGVDKMYA